MLTDELELAEGAELLTEEPEGAGDEPIGSKLVGHIPRKLMTPAVREEIQAYLREELTLAQGERQGFLEKVARWELAYEAPIPTSPKNFPIFNASNLTMPVIKEAVNTLAAQLVQATDTARPRWIFKDIAKEWEPFTDRVETFLDMASDRDMKFSQPHTDWVIECAKFGTAILEVVWEVDERRIYKYDESGFRAYPSTITLRDGPVANHIGLSNFWIRFHERDIQKARWVAKELEFTETELKQREKMGKFHSVSKVLEHYRPKDTDPKSKVNEAIEKTQPILRNLKVMEVWLSWDIDGDDTFEETKLYFHRDTGLLIGEFFNPYWHGKRPFVKIGYFPKPGRFYDEGLCEMLEQLQVAISNMANKRADNAAWANMKMLLKRRTVRNLQPGDPLYMGKIIEVNDPNSDIRELNLSEVYPSTINEERMMQSRVERVAGTNEGIAGAAMPVTRTTASAQIALLQEQAKRIDLTVRNIREGRQEVGWFVMQLYSQHGTNGKAVAWMGTKGHEVEAVFRMPRRITEMGASLFTQTPTSMQNKQVQRENKIALFNLLMQLHKEIFPLAQQFSPESVPFVAAGAIKGAQKFMADILEAFEEPDPEGILAGLAVLEKLLPQMENLGGLETLERGVEVSQILDRLAGLEHLAAETEAAVEDSRRISDPGRNGKRFSAPEGLPPGGRVDALIGGTTGRGERGPGAGTPLG